MNCKLIHFDAVPEVLPSGLVSIGHNYFDACDGCDLPEGATVVSEGSVRYDLLTDEQKALLFIEGEPPHKWLGE